MHLQVYSTPGVPRSHEDPAASPTLEIQTPLPIQQKEQQTDVPKHSQVPATASYYPVTSLEGQSSKRVTATYWLQQEQGHEEATHLAGSG